MMSNTARSFASPFRVSKRQRQNVASPDDPLLCPAVEPAPCDADTSSSSNPPLDDVLSNENETACVSDTDGDAHGRAVIKCKCRSTRCIKLYCDCFANGQHCGVDCMCTSCSNLPQNESTLSRLRSNLQDRNPHAYHRRTSNHRRESRCSCTKSRCRKRYCECFRNGVVCGPHCACVDCWNSVDTSETRDGDPILNALLDTSILFDFDEQPHQSRSLENTLNRFMP